MNDSRDPVELVTILETGDPVLLAMTKSVLDEAEIPYVTKGEQLQNLFGAGQIGVGFNPITGGVQIQVREDDELESRALLEDLLDSGRGSGSA